MGFVWLVDCRVGAGTLLSGFGGVVASFESAASYLRRADYCPVFLGHAGAAGLALCR